MSEVHKVNSDKNSEIIIYSKSKKVSSRISSDKNSNDYIQIITRNNKIEKMKKSQTYKSENMSMNSASVLKEKKNKEPKTNNKKQSEQSLNEDKDDKELQENEIDLNWRQMLKRFFENNNRINYVQNLIYIISLISFVFYVVCTYMPQLFKYLNYIDYFICPIYIIAHFINFLIAHQPF